MRAPCPPGRPPGPPGRAQRAGAVLRPGSRKGAMGGSEEQQVSREGPREFGRRPWATTNACDDFGNTPRYPQRKVQVLLVHRFKGKIPQWNQWLIWLRCDKTGASMRQNGLSIATKWVKHCDITGAPREHCDKTGAGTPHSVAKGANPP